MSEADCEMNEQKASSILAAGRDAAKATDDRPKLHKSLGDLGAVSSDFTDDATARSANVVGVHAIIKRVTTDRSDKRRGTQRSESGTGSERRTSGPENRVGVQATLDTGGHGPNITSTKMDQ